jgi:hypothetical protein
MPLTLEERVDTMEATLEKHDQRITACERCDAEQNLECTTRMAKLEITLNKSMAMVESVVLSNKTMIKVLVWTVVTLITILGSLLGVKVTAPEWLAGL